MFSYAIAIQNRWIPQIEPTDPLFVHPFDNPSQPLVANVFNGENFDN